MEVTTPEVTEKLWGAEQDIVTNESYTGKFLDINPGFRSSIHKHDIKKETFYVLSGVVALLFHETNTNTGGITMDAISTILTEGQAVTIEPGQYHSFQALVPARVIEFSTPHSDDDVTRVRVSHAI
jgi:mannose-6-phosphate isomerase-like protein (cupin superfamily)